MINRITQMTALSFLSYTDFYKNVTDTINGVNHAVNKASGGLGIGNICWGPVAHKLKHTMYSDSLIYIVSHKLSLAALTEMKIHTGLKNRSFQSI